MIDLERRFESLDRLDAPDLWAEIEYRTELRRGRIPTPRPRFTRTVAPRGVLVALGAAFVILAVVGLTTWLLVSSGSNTPPVITQAPTPPSLTTTPPDTTLPPTTVPATTLPVTNTIPDYEALGWQKVSSDTEVLGGDTFGAQWDQVIAGPDGYLAWGRTWNREDIERLCDENGCAVGSQSDLFQGTAWTSPDGVTWTKHDAPELLEIYFENPFVGGSITAAGPEYVGVGWVDDTMESFVVTSTEGATWNSTRLEMGPQEGLLVSDIAIGPSGWVAVGFFLDGTTFETGLASWLSTDGEVWKRTEWSRHQSNELPPVTDVLAAGPGFVAVGEDFSTWSSPDGVTWTRGADLPGFDPSQGWVPMELLDLAGGLVVVGEGGVVWSSPDGLAWTLIHQEHFGLEIPEVPFLKTAWSSGLGVVAFGGNVNGSQLFISPDGINWTSLPAPPNTRTVGPFGDDGIIAGVPSVWPPMTLELSGVEVWIWTPPE